MECKELVEGSQVRPVLSQCRKASSQMIVRLSCWLEGCGQVTLEQLKKESVLRLEIRPSPRLVAIEGEMGKLAEMHQDKRFQKHGVGADCLVPGQAVRF